VAGAALFWSLIIGSWLAQAMFFMMLGAWLFKGGTKGCLMM
jgi:hypothetical protein